MLAVKSRQGMTMQSVEDYNSIPSYQLLSLILYSKYGVPGA